MRMRSRWTIFLLTMLLALGQTPGAPAQDRPPDAPAGRDEPRDGRRLIPAFGRLAEIVEQLDLTDEQRRRVRAVFADLRETLADLRQAGGDPAAIREKVQQMQGEISLKLAEILTPEQLRKLRDEMDNVAERRDPPAPPGPPRRPTDPPTSDPAPPPMGDAPPMMGDMPPSSAAPSPADPTPSPAALVELEHTPPTLRVGEAAPALEMQKTDGKTLRLDTLRGRPVVLVFGSYSSPAFRSRVEIVEEMRKAYRNRIHIVYVYTREAHPVGVWEVERNRREKIAIEQHRHAGDRMTLARQTEVGLKLGGPVVVDDWENSISRLFGGFPNGAAVLDRDGVVVALQRWCDPSVLAPIVDEALQRPAPR